MKITSTLAIKYFNKNKRRSTGTIFAVTLVTIIITIILTIFISYHGYNENIIRNKGNWEAEFVSIEYSDAQEIAKDKNIKEISIYYDYGMSGENLNQTNNSFDRIHLYGYDKNKLKNSNIQLIEGRMPQNSNEIVISGKNNLNILDIGETVNLTFEGNTKNYTVVGLAKDYLKGDNGASNISDGKDKRFGAITFLDTNMLQQEQIVNASILLKNIRKIYDVTSNLEQNLKLYETENINKETEINRNELVQIDDSGFLDTFQNVLEEIGFSDAEPVDNEEIQTEKVIYNEELLEIFGISKNENTFYTTILSVGTAIIVIVSIVGIALIVTSFTITYRERIVEIEALTSLGMSKKQIRKMCLKEGTIIWAIRNNHRNNIGNYNINSSNKHTRNINK